MSDFLNIYNRPLQALQAEVDDNMDRFAVDDPSVVELQAGQAHAAFRQQGGFLTSLVLKSESDSALVDVLYSDADQTKPKLPASHAMLPVGPSDWPGGQHGPVRWVWHDLARNVTHPGGESEVTLVPRMAQGMPFIVRAARLGESVIALGLSATNTQDEEIGLSLGEYLYFTMPHASAADVRINGRNIDQILGEGASDRIDQGEAQFWPGFDGRAVVIMPHGPMMALSARLSERGQNTTNLADSIGMLLWRRPGQPFICLEPTAGYDPASGNENLRVAPGADILLQTSIIQL